MNTKHCFKCGELKPLDEFYKHKKMLDGRLGKCKACTKRDTTARRTYLSENDPEWLESERLRSKEKNRKLRDAGVTYITDPIKKAAHTALNNAVRGGWVTREPCIVCGAKAHAHHEDYSKPYDVVWLCPRHHQLRHSYLNKCEGAGITPKPVPIQFSR